MMSSVYKGNRLYLNIQKNTRSPQGKTIIDSLHHDIVLTDSDGNARENAFLIRINVGRSGTLHTYTYSFILCTHTNHTTHTHTAIHTELHTYVHKGLHTHTGLHTELHIYDCTHTYGLMEMRIVPTLV